MRLPDLKLPFSPKGRRRAVSLGAAAAMVAGVAAIAGPSVASASSHREAPLIAGDPAADNTDVYAFVSPDATDTVTMIANWLPFEEPNGGPNFYPWAENTHYKINIDNDGDALPDVTYEWTFTNHVRNPGTFLYNTGPVTSVNDSTLNFYQTYNLDEIDGNGGGATTTRLLTDAVAAPSLVGPASIPDYAPLQAEATKTLAAGGKTYVGQADDPFFLDLRVFDLLYGAPNLSEVGQDTLAGYNVNSIAIQVPKTALAGQGDSAANPVVGIWSTTDRRTERLANGNPTGTVDFTQVSRLGNPLVNEVVFPLALKDAFNSISPDQDATIPAAVDAVSNPILPPLIQSLYGIPAPTTPRCDLEQIYLQGVSVANRGLSGCDPNVPASGTPALEADLNGMNLNTDQAATLQPSEMLRLNMSVAPSADPNRLGVLAGQFDGFPNGRRLVDDVVDISLQAVEGAASQGGQIAVPLARGDYVDRNDVDFQSTFPYLALPHNNAVNRGPDQAPRTAELTPVEPMRVADTRAGVKPTAGSVTNVKVTGVGPTPIPGDAKAVVVNLTATGPTSDGWLTAYNCDDPRPDASNVNYPNDPAASASNLSVVGVSGAGEICVYTQASSHIIVDIDGYLPGTSVQDAVTPERVLETRAIAGQVGYTGVKPTAGQKITLDLSGVVPDGAKAVYLNVTAVGADAGGWITVYPDCANTPPLASTVNYNAGDAIPNLVLAPLTAAGTVCLYTSESTDIVADLVGGVPASSEYTATGPTRILETRAIAGQINFSGTKPGNGQIIEVPVTGAPGNVPDTASAVFLNVTTTDQSPIGYTTVWPCGTQQPLASSGNFRGSTTANLTVTPLGSGGNTCIFVSSSTDVIVDLQGYLPGIGLTS